VRRLDDRGSYPAVGALLGEAAWAEALSSQEVADVLRSSLREAYADASDAEMGDALGDVLDSMTAAEAFNFGSALSQIGKSATKLASDPTFGQIVRTAAPIAAGAVGAYFGGPLGAKVGSDLGNLFAQAVTAPPGAAPRSAPPAPPAAPVPAAPLAPPPPAAPALAPPAPAVPAALPASPATPVPGAVTASPPEIPPPPAAAAPSARMPAVTGGSAAAAQGLVLTQQPEVLRSLLATALGQHGRQQVSGIPVAQILSLFSQVLGQAAADADELMYLEQQPDATEGVVEDVPLTPVRSLYTDLLGADNLEFAEAAGWEGLD
jgi:hypothetical protein